MAKAPDDGRGLDALLLRAEVFAQQAMLSALVMSHPDPRRLADALEVQSEALLADLTASETSETFLAVIQRALERHRTICQQLRAL